MKKICSRCNKIIKHNEKCLCKINENNRHTKEHKKFYSSYSWQKLRNRKVMDTPYCERCWSINKQITIERLQGHHILSFKHYPHLALDDLNIAVLCSACNSYLGDSNDLDWEVSEEVREYVRRNR